MDAFEQFVVIFIAIAMVALPLVIGGSTIILSDRLAAERKERDKKSQLPGADSKTMGV